MTSLARDTLKPVQTRIKSVGRSASGAARDANEALSWAGETADDYLDTGTALVRSVYRRMEDRPLLALLGAMAAGLLLGHIARGNRR